MSCLRSAGSSGTEFGLQIICLTNICQATGFIEQLLWPGPGEMAVSKAQGLSSKASRGAGGAGGDMMAGESQHQVPVELTGPVENPHLGEGLFEHRRVSHLIPSPGGHRHASPHQPGSAV